MSYIDQQLYLSDDFSVVEAARALLQNTGSLNDAYVDFQPAITRIGYDIDEINKRVSRTVETNTGTLLQYGNSLQSLQGGLKKLNDDLENVNLDYSKIDREIAKPYQRARRAHSAFIKLHATASLVRDLTWYLQLASQVEPQARAGAAADADTLVQAAESLRKINELLAEAPRLRSLSLVQDHEGELSAASRALATRATAIVKEFDGNKLSLKQGLETLTILGDSIAPPVSTYLSSQIGAAVLQMSRGAGASLRAFETAFRECVRRGTLLETMDDVVSGLDCAEDEKGPVQERFWSQVAAGLDQKLKVMSVANPGAAKAIAGNRAKILALTEQVPALAAVFKKHL